LKISKVKNSDLLIFSPETFEDQRGYFFESFNQNRFENLSKQKFVFVQDNESKSIKGTLRGFHYQLGPFTQSKLVRVIDGEVLDVVVDVRKTSKNFGKHWSFKISSENKKQLFIPKGYAHAFLTLSDTAIFSYKVDNYFSPNHDRTIIWNDKFLQIDWEFNESDLIISGKDRKGLKFTEAEYL
jgi:dTDP-4-dehydrorhamnose 3,5-epimerase